MDIQTFTTLLNYKTFLPIGMIRGMMTTTTKNMVLLIAILMLADITSSIHKILLIIKAQVILKKIPKDRQLYMSHFSQISACACHSEGSLSSNCDTNGYCSCNGYDGEKCDPCQISSDEFPNCHSGGKFIV